MDKATVLIISEATDVVVNGSILYYNGEVKVKDNVATTSGKDNAIASLFSSFVVIFSMIPRLY